MEKEQPEYLYHYTTMSALFGMLNNLDEKNDDSIRFWASHISYMNDPTEYDFFISALRYAVLKYEKQNRLPEKHYNLKKRYDHVAKKAGDFFVLSLSEKEDDISMWRAYGANGQGVAIRFKLINLKMIIDEKKDGCMLKRIQYFNDKTLDNQITEQKIKEIHESLNSPKLEIDSSIMEKRIVYKDETYADEKEWRIVKQSENYNFREKGGLIVPYTEISIPLETIEDFTIGPCGNFNYSKMSLNMMLKKKLHNPNIDIPIWSSVRPYVIR